MHNGEYRITVNGVRHWCRVAGAEHQTVPLVVIHGGPGGNVYNFERTIGPLLEEFSTVLYYEQRGCGRSDLPASEEDYSIPLLVSDLDGLITALGLPRIIPLGFSFGGELAVHYALAHPSQVQKLILQAPSLSDDVRAACVQLYGFHLVATDQLKSEVENILLGDGPPQTKLYKVWGMVDRETVDRFLFNNSHAAKLNRKLWTESGLVNTGQMSRALSSQPKSSISLGALTSIKSPTLVLVGLYDRNVGVDACRDVSITIPGAKLVVFQESAHFPDIEEPTKYAHVVREFATEVISESHDGEAS